MKFYNMFQGQRLILIKEPKIKQPPTTALVAKSIKKSLSLRILICAICTMILMIPKWIANHTAQIYCAIRPKITVLIFLASILVTVVLEDVASSYVEKMVGVA